MKKTNGKKAGKIPTPQQEEQKSSPGPIAARSDRDYQRRGDFGDYQDADGVPDNWPSTRYQTMFGRTFDCQQKLEESFWELGRIRKTLLEHPDHAVADHAKTIHEIDTAARFMEMANGAFSATLSELENLERLATGVTGAREEEVAA